MSEKIFNLFIYIIGDFIEQIGVSTHQIDASDIDKITFLKNTVQTDYINADKINVKSCSFGTSDGKFKYSSYLALVRCGRIMEVFEEIFTIYGASKTPLFCVTPIVNGKPEIDYISDSIHLFLDEFEDHPKIGVGCMEDYLKKYITPDGFDIPQLLHDDFFSAIKLLFNNQYYVSCMKLIASFIDTVSYIEYGDVCGNFVSWLKEYSSLEKLGINESQLWELRNSILHMSNLNSRKNITGKVKRISFYATKNASLSPKSTTNIQYFRCCCMNQKLRNRVTA